MENVLKVNIYLADVADFPRSTRFTKTYFTGEKTRQNLPANREKSLGCDSSIDRSRSRGGLVYRKARLPAKRWTKEHRRMKQITLKGTDLTLSNICYGTGNFKERLSKERAFEMWTVT
jgi:hypothetical protein